MKKITVAIVLVTMMFSLAAFATEGKASIVLSGPSQVAGKELPKGEYNVKWTGTGDQVQVTFTSADKQVSVVAPAKVVQGPKARRNAVVQSEGVLKEIWISGKTESLVF